MSEPDPLHPWEPWQNLTNAEVCLFLGWSLTQLKRARADRVIPYYLNRGRPSYLAADVYAYKDSLRVEAESPKKVRRRRTPEHNAKIAESVRAARKKASKS